MLPELKPQQVSSLSAILSTIDNDRHTWRWFLMLISTTAIKQKLSVDNKIKEKYRALTKIQTTEIVILTALGGLIIAFCWTKQAWILLGCGASLIFLVILSGKNRRTVAAISEQFLVKNIPAEQLPRQTLYQTCEYLSKEYRIPSLVDMIAYQDINARKIMLSTLLFLPFITDLNSWQKGIFLLAVLAATLVVLNTSSIVQRIK